MSSVAMTRAGRTSMSSRTSSNELGDALASGARYPEVAAAVVVTFGMFVFAGSTAVVQAFGLPAIALASPLAVALAAWLAAYLIVRQSRRGRGSGGIDASVEQRILELAVASRGRVTVAGVAYATGIPLSAADASLTALLRAGYLGVEADPSSGVVVYVFPEVEAGLVPWRALDTSPLVAAAPAEQAGLSNVATLVRVGHRRRTTAAALAIFGGVFGAHKFYLDRPIQGLLYCVSFWTLLPLLAGVTEGIQLLAMSDQRFELEYNTRLV
jgi:TM2 domain-containing membrane protein YozV